MFQVLVTIAALALAAVGVYVMVATYLHVCARSSRERFQQAAGKPAVVLMHSKTCPHCVRFLPAFEAVASEPEFAGKVQFAKLERSEPGAAALQAHVRGYPTTLALNKEGKVVDSLVGNRTRQELTDFVRSVQ
jgi:thioredoxin-like negative regulator of GroEL